MPPKPITKEELDDTDGNESLGGDSQSREFIDPNNTKKWNENSKVIVERWLEPMHYVLVTLQYLNDCLKEKEATVGWWLILITSFTSFLTLFSPKELGTNTHFNTHYDWTKGVLLSVLSFTATLLASWAKKKGFVKRIKDLDKRIYAIETKRSVVSSVLALPIEDRPQYITFYKDNITEVQDLLCYNQLISPTEMNEVLYNLTKNYPTLIKDIKPWYIKSEGVFEPDYEYGYNVIKSFEKRKLNGFCFRLSSLFYCKSKCCYDIDDGNPFTNKLIMSQIDQQKKDDVSIRSSVLKKNLHNKEPAQLNNFLNILAEHNDGAGFNDANSHHLFADLLEKKSKGKMNELYNNTDSFVNESLNSRLSHALNTKAQVGEKINNGVININSKHTKVKKSAPIVVNLVRIVSIYNAVLSPGLIPGTNPPYFLKFSAVSLGLNVIDV